MAPVLLAATLHGAERGGPHLRGEGQRLRGNAHGARLDRRSHPAHGGDPRAPGGRGGRHLPDNVPV
eukprot:6410941-Pyramimonas_sp.AAC.1